MQRLSTRSVRFLSILRALILAASLSPLLALPMSIPSTAAEEGGLEIALNRVNASESACRFTFVFRNSLGAAINEAAFELVVFTSDGQIDRFVQISTGAMPKGKMRAKQFDFDKLDCTKVSRVLVNDVKTCNGQGLDPALCLSKLKVTGNKSIELVL